MHGVFGKSWILAVADHIDHVKADIMSRSRVFIARIASGRPPIYMVPSPFPKQFYAGAPRMGLPAQKADCSFLDDAPFASNPTKNLELQVTAFRTAGVRSCSLISPLLSRHAAKRKVGGRNLRFLLMRQRLLIVPVLTPCSFSTAGESWGLPGGCCTGVRALVRFFDDQQALHAVQTLLQQVPSWR